MPGEELVEDFKQTLTNGPMEFTYKKDLFYNFKTFFSIVPNAAAALKNSIIVSLYTILISLGIGSLAGFAMARFQFKFKEQINVSLLIVRMFPVVGISIPMAMLLIKFGLFDTRIGLALLYSQYRADGMDHQQYLHRNQQGTGRGVHDIRSQQCADFCEDHPAAGLSGPGGELDVFVFNSLE